MKKLTERELEVLQLVKSGYENNEIAKKIQVSRHTVKAHIKSIINKTLTRKRACLVCMAIKHGLLN